MHGLNDKPVLKTMVLSKKDELNLVQSHNLTVQIIKFFSFRTPEEPDQILAQISDSFNLINVVFAKESTDEFESRYRRSLTSICGSLITLVEYSLGLHIEAEGTTCHLKIMKFKFMGGDDNNVRGYPSCVSCEPEVRQWLKEVDMRVSQTQLPKFTGTNAFSQNNDSEIPHLGMWGIDNDDNCDKDELGEDWWASLKELTDNDCKIPPDQQAILNSLEEWKLPEEGNLTESSCMFTQYTWEQCFETQLDSQIFAKSGEGLSQITAESLSLLLPPTVSSSDNSTLSGFNSLAPLSNSLQTQISLPPHISSATEAHPDPPSPSDSDHSDGSAASSSSPPDGVSSVGRFDSRFDSQSSLEFVDADPDGDASGESVEIETNTHMLINGGAKSQAGIQPDDDEKSKAEQEAAEKEEEMGQIAEENANVGAIGQRVEEFTGAGVRKLVRKTIESVEERNEVGWMQGGEPLPNSDHVVHFSRLPGADSQMSDTTICPPSQREWSGIPASGSPALVSTQSMVVMFTQTANGFLDYESENESHVPLLESPPMEMREDKQRVDDERPIAEAATVRDLLENRGGQNEDENGLQRGEEGIVMNSQDAKQAGEDGFTLYIASTQETVDMNEQDGGDSDTQQIANTTITRETAADGSKKSEQDTADAVHTQDSAGSQTQIAAALLAPDSIASDDDNDIFTNLDFSHGSDPPRLSVLAGRKDTRALGARPTPSEKDEMEAEEELLVSSMGSDTIIVPTPQVGVGVMKQRCLPVMSREEDEETERGDEKVQEVEDESSYSQYLGTQMTEEGVALVKESLFVGSSMPEEAFGGDEIGTTMSDGVRWKLEVVVEVDARNDRVVPTTSQVETERRSDVGLSLVDSSNDKANTETPSPSRDYVESPTSPRSHARESSPELWVEIPVRVPIKKKPPLRPPPSVTPSKEKTVPQPKKRTTKKAPQKPRQTARLQPKPAPAVPPQVEYDVHSTTSSSSLSSREPSPSQEFIGAGKFRKKGEVEGEEGTGTEAKAEAKNVKVPRGVKPTGRNGARSVSDGPAWSGDDGSPKLSLPVQNVDVRSPTPRESDEEKEERIESTAQEIVDSIVVVVPRGQVRHRERDTSDASLARKKVRWENSQVEDDENKQQQRRIVARPKRTLVLRNMDKRGRKVQRTDSDAGEYTSGEDASGEDEQDPDWVEQVRDTKVQEEKKEEPQRWLKRTRKQKQKAEELKEKDQGKKMLGRAAKRLMRDSVEAKRTIVEFSDDDEDDYESLERPHTKAAAARSIVVDIMNARTKATPRKPVDGSIASRKTASRTNSKPIFEEFKRTPSTPAKTQTDTVTRKRTTASIPSEATPNRSYDEHGSKASTLLRTRKEAAAEDSEPAAPSSIAHWIAGLRAPVPEAVQKKEARVELEFRDDPEFPLRVPRRPLSVEVVAGVLRNARKARKVREVREKCDEDDNRIEG